MGSTHSTALYQKQVAFSSNAVFRVIATKAFQLPADSTKLLPPHISKWNRPHFLLNAPDETFEDFLANQVI